MEKKIIFVLKIAIAIISSLSFVYFVDGDIYKVITREDGELENLTALGLLAGSVLLFVKLKRLRKSKNTLWTAVTVIMILGLFFGFGEEISWGQRIFGIESNEFFSQNNAQNETNLHNLKVGDVKINKIIALVLSIGFGIYYLFFLLMYKKLSFVTKTIDTLGIPIPTVTQSLWFLGATLVIVAIPDTKKWEIWECIFSLSFLWILIAPYNTAEKAL